MAVFRTARAGAGGAAPPAAGLLSRVSSPPRAAALLQNVGALESVERAFFLSAERGDSLAHLEKLRRTSP
eukprot:COSAG01_NODE_4234_length_5218_cov_69.637429_6_plen_70_part_00